MFVKNNKEPKNGEFENESGELDQIQRFVPFWFK